MVTKNILNIKREVIFTGKRKVGLDSGILISLIDNRLLFGQELNKIFSEEDLFYVHRSSLSPNAEITKILMGKEYSFISARKEIFKFSKKHKIGIIEKNLDNKEILNELIKKCKKNKVEIHPPDSWIIADFKKAGINKVYSNNNHFLDAAKQLGMDGSKFPTIEGGIKDFFRKLCGYKNFKRRYHHR